MQRAVHDREVVPVVYRQRHARVGVHSSASTANAMTRQTTATPPSPPPRRAVATVHAIAAMTHGRYLVARAHGPERAPLLVGFHGYGEHAERHLSELDRIPGSARWTRVAVQALHRHYSEGARHVVGSWMTRQDRELAIADNLAYVRAVVAEVRAAYPTTGTLVCCGFSQGVAMAYRAAAWCGHACHGIVALGGDVPPELRGDTALAWPPVLIGRGRTDTWYSAEKLRADVAALRSVGAAVEPLVFDGGHEWTDDFRTAAGRFLAALTRESAP